MEHKPSIPRDVTPRDIVAVTVGTSRPGLKEYIISGAAELSVNVRKCGFLGGKLGPVVQLGACGAGSTVAYALPAPGVKELDPDVLEARDWVADIVDRPIETELVRRARAKGCDVDGGRMAVGQPGDALRIFTGLKVDAERMRLHFLEIVAAEELAA